MVRSGFQMRQNIVRRSSRVPFWPIIDGYKKHLPSSCRLAPSKTTRRPHTKKERGRPTYIRLAPPFLVPPKGSPRNVTPPPARADEPSTMSRKPGLGKAGARIEDPELDGCGVVREGTLQTISISRHGGGANKRIPSGGKHSLDPPLKYRSGRESCAYFAGRRERRGRIFSFGRAHSMLVRLV